MRFAHLPLHQRDGVTCGPSVAIVAAALLDDGYAEGLGRPGWFAAEQARLHRNLNRWWPRMLGTTPLGMVRALPGHTYRWRCRRLRDDPLLDVREAVLLGYPVPMLVGRFIPRHWVLLTEWRAGGFACWEPSSGATRLVPAADIRHGRLRGVGFPRAFGFVLPTRMSAQRN